MGLSATDFLINDETNNDLIFAPRVDGERKGHGCIPRDYSIQPYCGAAGAIPFEALDMPLIPKSEWSARIKEMEETKTRVSDIRRARGPNGGLIPSLDQDGVGYCWNHSATMCVMLLRAMMNQPYVRLSAFFVGCLIKNYRDEGGWGALALDFIMKNGLPSVAFWPEKSMSRSNDTPECRANAKSHLVTESWVDLVPAVYDRNLTFEQSMTLALLRCPFIGDFNWWGHSVCMMDPVEIEPGSFGLRGINSWTDNWGDKGEFVLQGSKTILDGGCAPRVTLPSAA